METHKFFGHKIKELREEQGISLKELAEKIGISKRYLAGIEQGSKKVYITTIFKVCKALNTEPGIVFKEF